MTPRRLLLVTMLTLALPAAGRAQCGLGGAWVAAGAGLSRYDVAGGTRAAEVGADLGIRPGGVAVRASYRRVLPEAGLVDPDVVRAVVAVPVARVTGVEVCGVAHGAGSRFDGNGEDATVLAGGLGIRVARPLALGRVLPYVEVRGLGATLSGRVLGLDVDAAGASLGGEAGVEAGLGRFRAGAAVSMDGFDAGLGVTPYPALLARLAAGVRFF